MISLVAVALIMPGIVSWAPLFCYVSVAAAIIVPHMVLQALSLKCMVLWLQLPWYVWMTRLQQRKLVKKKKKECTSRK